MKKFYFLLLTLICSLATSQQYSFDVVTKYQAKTSAETFGKETVIYGNTQNPTYYLSLVKTSSDFFAVLNDDKNEKIHRFRINEIRTDKGNEFIFTYLSSIDLKNQKKKPNKYRYELQDISQDLVNVKIYSSEKSKKPLEEIQLKLKASEKNMFAISQKSVFQSYENSMNFNLNRNVIIEKAESNCKKCSCIFTLLDFQNTDLVLALPNQINYEMQ